MLNRTRGFKEVSMCAEDIHSIVTNSTDNKFNTHKHLWKEFRSIYVDININVNDSIREGV